MTSGLSGCSPSNWSSSLGLGSGISNLDNATTAIRITADFHSSDFFKKAINVAEGHNVLNLFACYGAFETIVLKRIMII